MLSRAWASGWSSFDSLRRDMDELFERFFSDAIHAGSTSSAAITNGMANGQAETFLRDGKWIMRLDLPGVEPKDIDVSVAGGSLTIRASREGHGPEAEA